MDFPNLAPDVPILHQGTHEKKHVLPAIHFKDIRIRIARFPVQLWHKQT